MDEVEIQKFRADISNAVYEIGWKIYDLIELKSKELNLDDRNRWLLGARVSNAVWAMHHNIVLHAQAEDSRSGRLDPEPNSPGGES